MFYIHSAIIIHISAFQNVIFSFCSPLYCTHSAPHSAVRNLFFLVCSDTMEYFFSIDFLVKVIIKNLKFEISFFNKTTYSNNILFHTLRFFKFISSRDFLVVEINMCLKITQEFSKLSRGFCLSGFLKMSKVQGFKDIDECLRNKNIKDIKLLCKRLLRGAVKKNSIFKYSSIEIGLLGGPRGHFSYFRTFNFFSRGS